MNRDKVIMVALAIIAVMLLAFFFRGNMKLKDIKKTTMEMKETNKKLLQENNKLKASVVRYEEITDSLDSAVGDLAVINDDVIDVVASAIESYKTINSEIKDIIDKSKEVIEQSDSIESDDMLEPIIP